MKRITVGAAAISTTPLAWSYNKSNILSAISEAKSAGVKMLVLPEMCIPGYGVEDAFHSARVWEKSLATLAAIVPQTKGMVVTLGLPMHIGGAVYNCIAVVADGAIAGFVAKQRLPSSGVHYEKRYFQEWPNNVRTTVNLHQIGIEGEYPIGDLYFDFFGIRVGLEICEEAWVNARTGAELAQRGIDIFANPSASHFALGKHEIRKNFVRDGSRAFGATYIYANLLGNEAGRIIYDGGNLIASLGEIVAANDRFSFQEFVLTKVQVDIEAQRVERVRGVSSPNDVAYDEACISIPFAFPDEEPLAQTIVTPAFWEISEDRLLEEVTRAVALGLYHYMKKAHVAGFVVSLSGGKDSSATVAMVAKMVELGVAELGRAEFASRLPGLKDPKGAKSVKDIVQRLLVTCYTATRNSGEVTFDAAESLAKDVGAVFYHGTIDDMVAGTCTLVSSWLGRTLPWGEEDWGTDDIALQNVQARHRAPIAWLLANVENMLLLTTSNRSEAAVGYATMDGDTAGCLNCLGGISKTLIKEWLMWMERKGPQGATPIPVLSKVNVQDASAELRPQALEQTDEDDLGPYAVRDRLEDLLIQDWKSPLECFKVLRGEFGESLYSHQMLLTWIERFLRLWSRNQWKRERYAPCFHLDERNLDPRTWCRFPILSGGFREEIAELKEYVASLAS